MPITVVFTCGREGQGCILIWSRDGGAGGGRILCLGSLARVIVAVYQKFTIADGWKLTRERFRVDFSSLVQQ